MKELDFRPDRYRAGRRRKREAVARAMLFSVLAVEMVLVSIGTYAQTAAARAEMTELRGHFENQAAALWGFDELLANLGELRSKRELLSDVAGGVPAHRVLAELSRLMPAATVLTEVHLAQERWIGPASEAVGNDSRGTSSVGTHGEPRAADAGRLEITGWAASDVRVGTFMTNMTKSAVFDDVRLRFSRPTVVQDRQAREFKLTCGFPNFE